MFVIVIQPKLRVLVYQRENHDSSMYYQSRMYDGLVSEREVGSYSPLPEEFENIVLNCDSRSLPLPDNCVHLVVTSPPYNVTKSMMKSEFVRVS